MTTNPTSTEEELRLWAVMKPAVERVRTSFSWEELMVIHDAITQYVENHEDEDETEAPAEATLVMYKLDWLMAQLVGSDAPFPTIPVIDRVLEKAKGRIKNG